MKHEKELEKRTQAERKSFSIIDSTVQRTNTHTQRHLNLPNECSQHFYIPLNICVHKPNQEQ